MKVLLREAWARLKDANEHLGIINIKQETLPDLDLKTQKEETNFIFGVKKAACQSLMALLLAPVCGPHLPCSQLGPPPLRRAGSTLEHGSLLRRE